MRLSHAPAGRGPRGRALLSLLGGVTLSLAFPEPDLAPLAWFSIAPLLIVSAGAGARRALALGAMFGLGFFGSLLMWISIVGWVAWAVLVAEQAAFVATFVLLWGFGTRRCGAARRLLLAPTLWVAVEFVRSNFPLGGFTWGQLAQSQHDLLWLLRPAALGGGWAVSALVVLVNALVAEVVVRVAARRGPGATWGFAAGAAALLAAPLLLPAQGAGGPPVRVSIVQGNIPPTAGGLFEKEAAILRSHVELTREAAAARPDLVVWPESSVGLDIDRTPEVARAVARAARSAHAPLVVGGNLDTDDGRYRVMAFAVSENGSIIDRYQKTHLVPFGEYVPARDLLDWIPMLDQVPRDAVPGDDVAVFALVGGRVAPVISFEGDFGSLVRRRMAAGGRLLIVATNTSTWERSGASAQHLAFSQVRAAENGVWVVHAALTGISGFVGPDGRVFGETGLYEESLVVRDLRFAEDITFYARTGDWLPWLCLGISSALLVWSLTAHRRPRPRALMDR